MGFDYHIHLCLSICPETGEAFVGYGEKKIPYQPEKHRIPKEFCKYLQGEGSFFHNYMPTENGNTSIEYTDLWYYQFPSWEDINNEEAEENKWTEEDHNNLKELLKWLLENKFNAVVSWSY